MEGEKRHYGRKRVKKQRPVLSREEAPREDEQKDRSGDEEQSGARVESIAAKQERPRERDAASDRRARTRQEAGRPSERRPPRDRRSRADRGKKESRPRTKAPRKGRIRVSVVIPAYDEEDNVRPLLAQFDEVIRKAGRDWEVVFVNDGSGDKTEERARDASISYHWLKVIGHSKNRGLTAALYTGFRAARGTILVFYPADMQYHPQDIPRMIASIDRGADLVTGWRQGKSRRKFVSFIYNRLCRILFGLRVHDLNSVKAFKREVIEGLTMRRDWHRYMVVMAAEEGFRIDEAKVTLYPRKYGRSKFGTGRILGGLLDLFSVKFQISFMKNPLRFFGTWGFLFGLGGIITGIIALYLRFFTNHGSRTLLYLVILLSLSGLMLFAIGFLAEVMVGLREEIESLKARK
jgi:glycosyltransferase involved in cell wall biosynthesis